MNLLAELRQRFHVALEPLTEEPETYTAMVRPAQDARFGDYQANCAMPLGKACEKDPRDVAAQIVQRLDLGEICDPPEIAGPGFINLRLSDSWLADETRRMITDQRLGHRAVEERLHYIIDYSSPNVAKPMHVGHLRSTVIGDALVQVLRFQGHQVTGDSHIGDWGTQFGMIIYGYRQFLDQDSYAADAVGELARLYRLVSQLSGFHETRERLPALRERLVDRQAELEVALAGGDKSQKAQARKVRAEVAGLQEQISSGDEAVALVEEDDRLNGLAAAHPDIAEAARRETAKLHAGDSENLELWEEFLPACLEAMDGLYQRLGVEIDLRLGESYFQPMLAGVVEDLQASGIARESEGAICVFIEGNEAPFIVRKSDGAFTYATTDLATIRHRIESLNGDVLLYVVDARQAEHFRLLFETARIWGFDGTRFAHVSFGTILGDDRRPFKTRSGDTVGLESLIDESIARARGIVEENDAAKPDGPELDDESRAQVAETVGIGGIKYADLHHNRDSDYQFSWEKMLATNGDTATYMQYASARILGIFRRGGIDRDSLRGTSPEVLLDDDCERALAVALNRFADAIDVTATELRPNVLTQYLFELANAFTTFYNACPVLKEPDDRRRSSRLALCDLTARVLTEGLGLLGIETCSQM